MTKLFAAEVSASKAETKAISIFKAFSTKPAMAAAVFSAASVAACAVAAAANSKTSNVADIALADLVSVTNISCPTFVVKSKESTKSRKPCLVAGITKPKSSMILDVEVSKSLFFSACVKKRL